MVDPGEDGGGKNGDEKGFGSELWQGEDCDEECCNGSKSGSKVFFSYMTIYLFCHSDISECWDFPTMLFPHHHPIASKHLCSFEISDVAQ